MLIQNGTDTGNHCKKMTNCYWADLQSPFRSQDYLAAQEKTVDITPKCL